MMMKLETFYESGILYGTVGICPQHVFQKKDFVISAVRVAYLKEETPSSFYF